MKSAPAITATFIIRSLGLKSLLNTNLFNAYVEPAPRPTSKILPSSVRASIKVPDPCLGIIGVTIDAVNIPTAPASPKYIELFKFYCPSAYLSSARIAPAVNIGFKVLIII